MRRIILFLFQKLLSWLGNLSKIKMTDVDEKMLDDVHHYFFIKQSWHMYSYLFTSLNIGNKAIL
ncbi:hypothetical protein Ngar_c21670 [Candidatus Nitrososphaera gargensis Ga9.2]|uniref:Uncharacterized protein n=1 Tax=Nitrososphaera gargensis (strain Ga9.2) TaxID=1237085 RepID=K0IKQ4_NITGG|nr:hypothetical protein Ngar_c21670 [Candidatus Nitrososphaera gargensis Ga9.2]